MTRINRVTIMDDGAKAAAVAAAVADKPGKDPLAGLDQHDRDLVKQVLQTYPDLTPAKAVEMLKEFGGI